jgi:microtubule-associated protein-like 6
VYVGKRFIITNNKGHFEELWGLAAHPTKGLFATGGDDKTIRLWDSVLRTLKKLINVEDKAKCLDFSPNGNLLAAGLENGKVLKNIFE